MVALAPLPLRILYGVATPVPQVPLLSLSSDGQSYIPFCQSSLELRRKDSPDVCSLSTLVPVPFVLNPLHTIAHYINQPMTLSPQFIKSR